MEDYSKYSDESLIKMWEYPYDLDENKFFVLGELEKRKHPKTKQYCLEILTKFLKSDQFFVSSALESLYSFDEAEAVDYVKEHYKELHIHALGSLVSLLWVDSNEANPSEKKKELIKFIKEHLKTLKGEEIAEIQEDYDEFMKAYKDV